MEVWILTFFIAFQYPIIGGEYQSEDRCRVAAAMQESWWRRQYGRSLLRYECKAGRL